MLQSITNFITLILFQYRMHEGLPGKVNQGIPLQLPPDAEKLASTSSFDLYRSARQREMILYPTAYRTEQLHIDAADLERIIAGDQLSNTPQESAEAFPEKTQFYDRTANWKVYAATDKIIIKPLQYHTGQLVLTFDDLKILRGLSSPR